MLREKTLIERYVSMGIIFTWYNGNNDYDWLKIIKCSVVRKEWNVWMGNESDKIKNDWLDFRK